MNRLVDCAGIRSAIGHKRHIVLLDYDNAKVDLSVIVESLQHIFDLGTAYVFRSSGRNSFHVVFLDIVTLPEYRTIMSMSGCDRKFQSLLYKRVQGKIEGVLRFTGKGRKKSPKLWSVFTRKGKRNWSFVHWVFFDWLYTIPQPEGAAIKGFSRSLIFHQWKLKLVRYKTHERKVGLRKP